MLDSPALQTLLDCSPWFLFFQSIVWSSVLLGDYVYPKAYRGLKSSRKALWASTAASLIHSVIITCLVLYGGLYQGRFINNVAFHVPGDDLARSTLQLFLGYMLSDTLVSLYHINVWPDGKAMMLHHIMCINFAADFLMNDFGHQLGLGYLLLEATTPFLSIRWFILTSGYKDSALYFWNGIVLLTVWLVVRILHPFLLAYWIFLDGPMTSGIWVLNNKFSIYVSVYSTYTLGLSLNWFWFIKLIKGAIQASSLCSNAANALAVTASSL